MIDKKDLIERPKLLLILLMMLLGIVMLFAFCSIAGLRSNEAIGQIVEKGEYSRLQYITSNNIMTPEFIQGYYIVVRNGTTGAENREWVSNEEYDACVVGDTIDNTRERW